MEEKPEVFSADVGDHGCVERKALSAKLIDKLKSFRPRRRHLIVATAVVICVYIILAIKSDLRQSVAIAAFYDRLSMYTEEDKGKCGDRRKAHQINAHYSEVVFLKSSPEVTAKATILDDGPCLSALIKSLHDAGPGIHAVIGDLNAGTKSVLVEIAQP